MNAKAKIPDRTNGGTFIYDKDGAFVEHVPPTKLPEPESDKGGASAPAKPAAKKGSN